MPVWLLPDVLDIVIDHFIADTGVHAVVADRIYPGRPKNLSQSVPGSWPFLTVKRLGGVPRFPKLDEARIQVDAWALTSKAAWDAINAARSAMWNMTGPRSGEYVTGVRDETAPTWLPDPTTGEPRYVLSMLVYAS